MSLSKVSFAWIAGACFVGSLAWAPSALAIQPKTPQTELDAREFFRPELSISTEHVRGEKESLLAARSEPWTRLLAEFGNDTEVWIDPRSDAPSSIVGRLPLIPGNGVGNQVTLAAVATRLGRAVPIVDAEVVAELVRGVVLGHREALGIRAEEMGPTKAAPVTDQLWHVAMRQQVEGVPVRHAHFVATLSHGNLVLMGSELWGPVEVSPRPTITPEQALTLGFAYIGGRLPEDELWRKPELEIIPIAPQEHQSDEGFTGPRGAGYGHRLTWVFGFQRPPEHQSWEVLVDAHSGEVLALEDTNHYAAEQIQGGVYPLTSTGICPTNELCGTMQPMTPMPYTNTGQPAPNDMTNSAGIFEYLGGTITTTLTGRYVRIVDSCGTLTESSSSGSLDLGGFNNQHDCQSGGASLGNTPAARSAFYEVNKLAELARGWLPNNTWLQNQLRTNVNLNQTCNAFWSPSAGTINFYRSGGGCRNTGEIGAVFDHEWGHGLDDNDSVGSLSSSSEAYADIAAIYRLQASCVGYGFFHTQNRGCGQTGDGTGFNQNESLTGTHCNVDCSGVRDADWAKHTDGVPDTPQNFVCGQCTSGTGPCGRQVHCSAAPIRQAAWDFVERDLQNLPFNYDRNHAFIVGNKLFYQGSGAVGSWHACTCPSTSNGCGATNGYMQWLAADDDNGNLNDGTPHMTAIFAAFDRHGVACATPTPQNGGCSGGPTQAPNLTITGGNNSLDLSWTPVPNAVSYRVLRTEGHAGCNFGKALIATVSGTSYTDPEVANGREYSYVVHAVGTSGACFGPSSPCVNATPQPCAGSIALDGSVYNCADVVSISLVDADLGGSGSVVIDVSSATESAGEPVTLVESPANSGRFVGTVTTTDAVASTGDGAVSVSDGDTLVASYVDASFCGTPDITVQGTRQIDCSGPEITAVGASEVTGASARISWTTNELADGRVVFDTVNPPLAGSASSASLAGTHSFTLTGLSECTTYYYRVESTDAAGNVSVDDNGGLAFAFETGRDIVPVFPGSGPVAIPDNSPSGATSSVQVDDLNAVADVNVTVNVSHTETGDLILSLVGPDGTTVILSNRRGGTGDNFNGTTFDDEAPTAITAGSAPFIGSFRPEQPLSAFDGKVAEGTWTLKVVDAATTDVGTINSWSLQLTYPTEPCGPQLRYQSHGVEDSCNGGGDGGGNLVAEGGEDVALPVVLRNTGIGGVTGVWASLSTNTPGVSVVNPVASYPDLLPGETADSLSAPFSIVVDPSIACGTLIGFSLTAQSNEGNWLDDFTVRVGTQTFATVGHLATAVPINLSDNGTSTSVLPVVAAATVTDVNVTIHTTHERLDDLDIFLVGPDGTRVELTSDNGGTSGLGYVETVFDDEAATAITAGSPPFSGSFRPEQPLSAFNGRPAGGNWTLEVRDDASGNVGKLIAWSLQLTTPSGYACEGCSAAAPSEGVTDLLWSPASTSSLEWSPAPSAAFYRVYRGGPSDLPALLDGSLDSCLVDTTANPTTGDALGDAPAVDEFYWYLVVAATAGGDGPAGAATDGPRVVNSSGPCP